jgi:type IV pilus assembly protein PilW
MTTKLNQKGVSLIELMIGLLLGTFVMLGLIRIFETSKQTYTANEGLSRIQEAARAAQAFIADEVQLSGQLPCINTRQIGSLTSKPVNNQVGSFASASPGSTIEEVLTDLMLPLRGYDAPGTGPGQSVTVTENGVVAASSLVPTVPTVLAAELGNVRQGSDLLVTRAATSELFDVISRQSSSGLQTKLKDGGVISTIRTYPPALPANGQSLQVGDYAVIANCLQQNIVFRVNSVSAGGPSIPPTPARPYIYPNSYVINTTIANTQNYKFGDQSRVGRVDFAAIFVGVSNAGGVDETSLFRLTHRAGNWQRQELVQGVESMQILYGSDRVVAISANGRATTVGRPVGYFTAAQIDANAVGHVVPSGLSPRDLERFLWRAVGVARVSLIVRGPRGGGRPATGIEAYCLGGDRGNAQELTGACVGGAALSYRIPADTRFRQVVEISSILARNGAPAVSRPTNTPTAPTNEGGLQL